jgi:hypothetical protein
VAETHNLGHYGAERIFKELWHKDLYWPGMKQDCIKHVAGCMPCFPYNIGKTGFHERQFIEAKLPFQHISIDTAKMPVTTPLATTPLW